MKTVKLIFGILCIVLAAVLLFQSCAVTVGEAILEEDASSGIGGSLVGFLMLAVGIIMIATRKGGIGGSIACLLISTFSAIICFTYADQFADLKIWGSWSLIISAINYLTLIFYKKPKENN